MISFLNGTIESKETGSIVINVNGVGYLIHVPSVDKFVLSQNKQTIFTHLYIREDRIVLYGFLNDNERDFFKILLDTPGIGPKVALNVLAEMEPEEFRQAIIEEDLNLISSISGIGDKLAKKIVLELKEKLKDFKLSDSLIEKVHGRQDFVYDAVEAMKALGYQEKEAKQRIAKALKNLNNHKSITVEDLIKSALNKDIKK
ncbi:MAG: Holliday junction branch migration protein RuvA [Atribacterota bacterium]